MNDLSRQAVNYMYGLTLKKDVSTVTLDALIELHSILQNYVSIIGDYAITTPAC